MWFANLDLRVPLPNGTGIWGGDKPLPREKMIFKKFEMAYFGEF